MKKIILYFLYGLVGIGLIPIILFALPGLVAGFTYMWATDWDGDFVIYALVCASSEILILGLLLFLW